MGITMIIDKLEIRESFKVGRNLYTILAFKDKYVHTVDQEDRFHPFPYGINVKRKKTTTRKRKAKRG